MKQTKVVSNLNSKIAARKKGDLPGNGQAKGGGTSGGSTVGGVTTPPGPGVVTVRNRTPTAL